MKTPKQPPIPPSKRKPGPSAKTADQRAAVSRQGIDDDASEGEDDGRRIAKLLARAGLCSRRDAERWIKEGRVAVNGVVLTSPACVVGRRDRVTVDGEPLPERERTRLWLYHKPRGLVTTARDPEGRPTVFANLPRHLPRVVAVGRLDINTEGLLLLTNDGGLARVLELPSTGWLRRYRARAWGEVMQPDLDRLRDGVTIDGMMYGAIDAALERVQGSNVWIDLALREGKNREVKTVLAHLGLDVNRLIRISYGPFQLGDLAEGETVEIRGRVLRDQLGETLAAEAGVDFDAPIRRLEPDEPAPPRAPRAGRRPAPVVAGDGPSPRAHRPSAKEEAAEELPRRRGRPISDRRRLAYEQAGTDDAAQSAAGRTAKGAAPSRAKHGLHHVEGVLRGAAGEDRGLGRRSAAAADAPTRQSEKRTGRPDRNRDGGAAKSAPRSASERGDRPARPFAEKSGRRGGEDAAGPGTRGGPKGGGRPHGKPPKPRGPKGGPGADRRR